MTTHNQLSTSIDQLMDDTPLADSITQHWLTHFQSLAYCADIEAIADIVEQLLVVDDNNALPSKATLTKLYEVLSVEDSATEWDNVVADTSNKYLSSDIFIQWINYVDRLVKTKRYRHARWQITSCIPPDVMTLTESDALMDELSEALHQHTMSTQ